MLMTEAIFVGGLDSCRLIALLWDSTSHGFRSVKQRTVLIYIQTMMDAERLDADVKSSV